MFSKRIGIDQTDLKDFLRFVIVTIATIYLPLSAAIEYSHAICPYSDWREFCCA